MKIKENYAAIERTVALVKEKFGADSKIAVMFEKCISNTLQTTIKIKENDTVLMLDALESGISEYLTMFVPEEYFAGKKGLVQ